jgi:hypothetical protein
MKETCGCCGDREAPTAATNRPGLDRLTYRAGTHVAFLEAMKARLSAADHPALGALTTRAPSDPSIALLDAWATVADVLTFYAERIANEGYLRTATERLSVLELARLVGYAPRPGVAASVYLAFTLEDTPEGRHKIVVPAGTRAQSVPGPGELPQFFETAEELEASAEWNVLKPLQSRPQTLRPVSGRGDGDKRLYLRGTTTNLAPNDPLLIDYGEGRDKEFFRVTTVEPDPDKDRTLVTLELVTLRAGTTFAAARPDPAERIEDISRRVEGYLDLEANEVSPERATTRRVVGVLEEWREQLTPETPPERLAASLRDTVLPQIRQDLGTARERNYTHLSSWLESVEGGLREIEGELSEAAAAEPGEPQAPAAPVSILGATAAPSARIPGAGALPSENGGPPSKTLEGVLDSLAKPPSAQPTDASRLPRRLEKSFGTDSDAVPKLLTALRPELGDSLYQGWEQTGAEPSGVRVYALRVTAAPFGHNAPKKAILKNGNIDRYEEWALSGEDSLAVSLDASYKKRIPPRSWVVVERPSYAGSVPKTVIAEAAAIGEASRADYGMAAQVTRISLPQGQPWLHLGQNPDGFSVIRGTIVHTGNELLELAETPPEVVGEDGSVRVEPVAGGRIELDGLREGLEPGRRLFFTGEREDLPGVEASELVMLAGVEQRVAQAEVEAEDIWQIRNDPRQAINFSGRGSTGPGGFDLTISARLLPDGSATGYAHLAGGARGEVVGVQPPVFAPPDYYGQDFWCVSVRRTDTAPRSGEERVNFYVRDLGDGKTAFDQISAPKTAQECDWSPRPWLTLVEGDFRATIDKPDEKVHSTLALANDLAYPYKRETVKIYGNVARATHGETRLEALGSGDGGAAFQRFVLKQSPLTHLAATTPDGVRSTLEVYVNDVRWHEAEHLAGFGPTDRRFVTQTDDGGEVSVVFGDGRRGARLPSGAENVRTVYRTGIGRAGNVAAGRISQLAAGYLGLKGVINPQPATGGADRETRDGARRNAPLGVKVFDRLVSVRDYEDFARAFAGIGKASATRLSDGRRQIVHLTVAGADDIPIAEDSDVYRHLLQALRRFGDPQQPLRVEVRELLLLIVAAGVRLLADYLWVSVEPKIRAALLETFGFERRGLGQDAYLSEAIGAIQRVPGVAYVDVDAFGGIPEKTADPATGSRRPLLPQEIGAEITRLVRGEGQPAGRVAVALASSRGTSTRPAQLAFLTPRVPDTLILKEITS